MRRTELRTCRRCALIACCMALLSGVVASGQVPSTVVDAPPTGQANEQFCMGLTISNAGAAGFGPYVRLLLPPDVQFDSATLTGVGVTTAAVGTFPAAPGNTLADPVNGDVVTGPAGGSFVILRPQVGSIVAGGPTLRINACCTILDGATIGAGLTISAATVYEFGDTATGTNGSIVGPAATDSISPSLVIFEKLSDAIENERPPGPGFPITYTLRANIANNKTISNLVFEDVLPGNIQYVGPITMSGGVNGVAVLTPSTVVPGGTLQVTFDSGTGTAAAADVTVSFPAFITDILDETGCGSLSISNPATLDAEFPLGTAIAQQSAALVVEAKHATVRKAASASTGVPGDVITYTVNFAVTEFGTVSGMLVADTIPDGMDFTAHGSLIVNGGPVVIVPSVVLNPGPGTTTVGYNITNVTGNLPPGATGTLVFTGTIRQTYASSALPVLSLDTLQNRVDLKYDLTAGAVACTDNSTTTITIADTTVTKTIVNPQAQYAPGDTVTFRLTLNIPSGDTQTIVFDDYLPIPALRVATIDTTGAPALPTPSIRLAPTDTLGLNPTAITTDAALNRLRITWPNISAATPQVLAVDVDIVVGSEPKAAALILASVLQVTTTNSVGATKTALAAAVIAAGTPSMRATKGVLSTSNPGATISPAAAILPPDGNVTGVDAGDTVTYQITVENTGTGAAFDVTVIDTTPAGLTGCTVTSVINGLGAPIATAGDLFTTGLVLAGSLSANDGNPAGGGAPFGADTAIITVACTVGATVETGAVLTNVGSVTWASVPAGPPFPPVTDNCTTTIAGGEIDKSVISSSQASSIDPTAVIGEEITYQLTITVAEGVSTTSLLRDTLPAGLGLVSLDSITASPALATSHAGGFAGVLADATATLGCTGAPVTVTFPFDDITNSDNDNATDETIVVLYTVRVCNNAGSVGGTTLTNNAHWISANQDISDDHTTTVGAPALNITKSANPSTANVGDTVTYTVTVSHEPASNADAFDLVLTDSLTTGLTLVAGSVTAAAPGTVVTGNTAGDTSLRVELATLAQGATYSFTYQATAAARGTLVNTATVNYDTLPGDDPNEQTFTDTGTSTLTVGGCGGGGIDLRISKTANRSDAIAGEVIVYTLTYSNAGTVTSPGVVINETVPANTTFEAAQSTAGWSCADGAAAGTACQLTIGDLAGGAGGTATFAVRVNDPLPSGPISIANVVNITDDCDNDDEPDDNEGVAQDVNARPTYAEERIRIIIESENGGLCGPLCGLLGFFSLSLTAAGLVLMKWNVRRGRS